MRDEERLATTKQLAYIERLSTDCKTTIAKPLGEMTMQEASEVIDDLLDRVNGCESGNDGGQNTVSRSSKRYDSWSNGARIGLVFKVCHRCWTKSGVNIFQNKERFIGNLLATYRLLNEIAEKAEAAS
jgi:hypothetical protein